MQPDNDTVQVSAPPVIYQNPQPTAAITAKDQPPSIGDFVTAPIQARTDTNNDTIDATAVVKRAQEEASRKFSASPEQVVNTVIMQGLNKVNGHISRIETRIAGPVRFENIEITPVRCWKAPPDERAENAVLLEIREIKKKAEPQKIFLGWMFSSSPGLSGLEHPLYDIRVLSCEYRVNIPQPTQQEAKPEPEEQAASPKAAAKQPAVATATAKKPAEKAMQIPKKP